MNDQQRLQQSLNKLQVQTAIQNQQIKELASKVDNIQTDIREMRKSMIGDLKTSNDWMRGIMIKVFLAGAGGGGIASIAAEIIKNLT